MQDTSATYEIILINDGSSDGSGAICDEYAERYHHVSVVHNENHGVSHARNTGIALAKGKYILFVDSDDFWEQGLLSAIETLSAQEPDMMVFGNYYLLESGKSYTNAQDAVIPAGESGLEYLNAMFRLDSRPRAYPVCYVYRRSYLQEQNLRFREDMIVSEDFELLYRCFATAKCMVGTSQPFYCYRLRAGSATSNLTAKKLMDNLISKEEVFRRYPVSAMANLYADNAVLIAELPETDSAEAIAFLKENRDIWKYVSDKSYKLGRLFVTLLGDRNGARMYYAVRSIVRKLQHRSEI
jgi:glycosyltransferase involved in cell wall biosynthesis